MSKDAEQSGVVPGLRFPEFREAGAWRMKPLKDFGARVKKRNADESVVRVLTNSAEHGVLDQRDYFDKDIATAGKLDNYFVVEEGDYVYNPRISRTAPVGPISRNEVGQGVMSPLYTVFRLANEVTGFHTQYFATSGWHAYLRSVSSSGARHDRMSVGIADFMKLPLPVPDPAEQRKIAACLGSLDDWLAAEARALAALRRHKTGLMQQLFPRPGQTRPRLRLPEFADAGDWRNQSTKQVCERIMDGTHFSPQSKEGPRPYLTSKNVRDGYLDLSTLTYISEADHQEIYARCPVQKDDVFLTKDGASTGNCAINTIDEEVSLLSSVAVLRANREKITPGFLYHTIWSTPYREQLFGSVSGQAITRITLTKLAKYSVALPELAEQRRIADCLASMDARLAAQADHLAALRHHKRGLMQQLFPAPS